MSVPQARTLPNLPDTGPNPGPGGSPVTGGLSKLAGPGTSEVVGARGPGQKGRSELAEDGKHEKWDGPSWTWAVQVCRTLDLPYE